MNRLLLCLAAAALVSCTPAGPNILKTGVRAGFQVPSVPTWQSLYGESKITSCDAAHLQSNYAKIQKYYRGNFTRGEQKNSSLRPKALPSGDEIILWNEFQITQNRQQKDFYKSILEKCGNVKLGSTLVQKLIAVQDRSIASTIRHSKATKQRRTISLNHPPIGTGVQTVARPFTATTQRASAPSSSRLSRFGRRDPICMHLCIRAAEIANLYVPPGPDSWRKDPPIGCANTWQCNPESLKVKGWSVAQGRKNFKDLMQYNINQLLKMGRRPPNSRANCRYRDITCDKVGDPYCQRPVCPGT